MSTHTHTPIASAAMAVPTFKSFAILLAHPSVLVNIFDHQGRQFPTVKWECGKLSLLSEVHIFLSFFHSSNLPYPPHDCSRVGHEVAPPLSWLSRRGRLVGVGGVTGSMRGRVRSCESASTKRGRRTISARASCRTARAPATRRCFGRMPRHQVRFPSFDLLHRLCGPRPVFTPKRTDCKYGIHWSSTLDLPWDVFTCKYPNIFPMSLIRGLHSFFNCILRFSLPIHGTYPKILNFAS